MDVLKRNVEVYMKYHAMNKESYRAVIYSTSVVVLNLTGLKKKKEKKTQVDHDFYHENVTEKQNWKWGFWWKLKKIKIKKLKTLKWLHTFLCTDTDDVAAAHANLFSTECIPWMRVLQ